MSFTAFSRGSQQHGSASPVNRFNGTNGDSHHNGNGNGNGNGHASNGNGNGNGHHSSLNGNGHANGHTNDNGYATVNGNGHATANGKSNRLACLRASISSDVTIIGTVKFRSELVIDGKVEGTIESHGRLTIGKNGHVRGDIQTRSVTVHGTVDGNLSVGEKCELRSGCTMRGDVDSSRLVVDEDVNFIGNAAIATRDYLAELRMPNGHSNGNGQHANNGNGQNGSNGQH